MFICNVKVNGGRILKIIIVILSIFMLVVFGITIYRIFIASGKFVVRDNVAAKEVTEILPENYTNVLQAVHDNPDSYIGMKIKFTGYMYRLLDFTEKPRDIIDPWYYGNFDATYEDIKYGCEKLLEFILNSRQ